jgi:hypothetical protein
MLPYYDREFWIGLLLTVIFWGFAGLLWYFFQHPTV